MFHTFSLPTLGFLTLLHDDLVQIVHFIYKQIYFFLQSLNFTSILNIGCFLNCLFFLLKFGDSSLVFRYLLFKFSYFLQILNVDNLFLNWHLDLLSNILDSNLLLVLHDKLLLAINQEASLWCSLYYLLVSHLRRRF